MRMIASLFPFKVKQDLIYLLNYKVKDMFIIVNRIMKILYFKIRLVN